MVQTGTPEEYFGAPPTKMVFTEPIPLPTVEAKIVEPVEVQYPQAQLQTPDYTPLIIGVCFLATVCFLGFLAWTWKR